MDSQFWITAWNEGRTAFHGEHYHEKLTKYFPQFNPGKGQRVLVPLCGKSKDLLWLHGLNLHVHGVELHAQAVNDFFSENGLSSPQIAQDQDFTHYTHENIIISCGDFFKLNEHHSYDYIYDRAALVALPAPMRNGYAQVIKQSLKPGGKYLLIVYDYDQSKMEGPPFHVGGKEIHDLYEDQFTITLKESQKPKNEGTRLSAIDSLHQTVYVLEKIL
ncbi:thiopurine S-methyltransferase [Nitrospira sp. MA-1]|nr:thiopurine S-methyltransferase [Nitrospira sp. MA-1]